MARLNRKVRVVTSLYGWLARRRSHSAACEPAIGLALGGGFARGIAHIGILRVLEAEHIPIRFIGGVSAGAMVAAAYASGTGLEEITQFAKLMRFKDVARWSLNRLGLVGSDRMVNFLQRLLKVNRFEEMAIPLAVAATDLTHGKALVFEGKGDVILPIRASCSYPGLFRPVRYEGRHLVDGAISMEVPAQPLRRMGATRVISAFLPMQMPGLDPHSMFEVVNRCFQVMHSRTERQWRQYSDLVIAPDVGGIAWDSFESAEKLIESGERAARAALPQIRSWLTPTEAAA